MRGTQATGGSAMARRLAVVAALTAMATACGGASSSSGGGGSTNSSGVSMAQQVQSMALRTGVTANPWATGDLVQVGASTWNGPTALPAPTPGKRLLIANNCGPACDIEYTTIRKDTAPWGWTVDALPDGTGAIPQGQQLMDTAISRKPDGILAIGIAAATVGQQLAKAKAAGILTEIDGDAPSGANPDYDAYRTYPWSLIERVSTSYMIADSKGKANILYVYTTQQKAFVDAVAPVQQLIRDCGTCALTLVDMPFVDTFDPVKVDQQITSALNSNPNINYVFFTCDCMNFASGLNAVRRLGKQDKIKVAASVASPPGIAAVAKGDLAFDIGPPTELASLGDLTQFRLLLADQQPRGGDKLGYFVHAFTKEQSQALTDNTAIDNKLNGYFDYRSIYYKALGITGP